MCHAGPFGGTSIYHKGKKGLLHPVNSGSNTFFEIIASNEEV